MIGAEILTWGTQGGSYYNPFLRPFWAWQFGGSTGHAAIKLTLPASYADEVRTYCTNNEDHPLIPHHSIKLMIPSLDESGVEEIDAIVVYFSIWPSNKTKFEHQDRISSVYSVKGVTTPKVNFDPEELEILDEHREAAIQAWDDIKAIQDQVDELDVDILEKYFKYARLRSKLTLLIWHSDEEISQAMIRLQDKMVKIGAELTDLQDAIIPKENKLRKLMESYFQSYLKEFGKPDHCVYIPFKTEQAPGLDPILMLKQMRLSLEDDLGFHFYVNNCSSYTRSILLAGISPSLQQQLKSSRLMSGYDMSQALIDAPLRVLYTAERLQDAVQKLHEYAQAEAYVIGERMPLYLPSMGPSEQPIQDKLKTSPDVSEGRFKPTQRAKL